MRSSLGSRSNRCKPMAPAVAASRSAIRRFLPLFGQGRSLGRKPSGGNGEEVEPETRADFHVLVQPAQSLRAIGVSGCLDPAPSLWSIFPQIVRVGTLIIPPVDASSLRRQALKHRFAGFAGPQPDLASPDCPGQTEPSESAPGAGPCRVLPSSPASQSSLARHCKQAPSELHFGASGGHSSSPTHSGPQVLVALSHSSFASQSRSSKQPTQLLVPGSHTGVPPLQWAWRKHSTQVAVVSSQIGVGSTH